MIPASMILSRKVLIFRHSGLTLYFALVGRAAVKKHPASVSVHIKPLVALNRTLEIRREEAQTEL
jgi:hypothetical protein